MHADDDTGTRTGVVRDALRHQVLLIVAFGLLGLLAGLVFTAARPATYVSTAAVLVNPVEGNAFAPQDESDALVTLETEAEIVGSDVVTALARNRLPGPPPAGDLQDGLSVVVPTNTQILQISARAPSAAMAQRRAQAYSLAYLDYRRRQAEQASTDQLAGVERQIAEVTGDLGAVTAESQSGTAAEQALDEQLADALNEELLQLRASRVELASAAVQPGRVISASSLPAQAAGVPDPLLVLAAVIAGLLVGTVIAMGRERRNDRVYGQAEVERAGADLLATLSRRRGGDRDGFEEVIRHLRMSVMEGVAAPGTIVVSCGSRDTEPGVAARLADSMSQAGRDVVLVDLVGGELDPGGPIPDSADAPGAAESLLGEVADPRSLLMPVAHGLRVLPAGRRLEEAVDRFLPADLEALLRLMADDADYVVVRSPTVLNAGGEAMAATASATLLVAIPGVTRQRDLAAAVAVVRRYGDSPLGVVLSPPVLWSRSSAPRPSHRGEPASAPEPRSQPGQGSQSDLPGQPASRPSPT
jgi:polysaccharide biosynthesis transport protein